MPVHCQELRTSAASRGKSLRLAALLALSPLLIGGCWNGRLLVAAEQPWWVARGGEARLLWPLAKTALVHGFFPRFFVIGAQEDSLARLRQELASRRYAAAVVSPLLSQDPQGYALSFAATRFLLVDGPQPVPGQPNAVPLSFERAPSFHLAGLAAGLSISSEAGGTVSSAFAQRIGVLTSAHPPGTQAEIIAFAAGVAQALDGGQPVIRKLSDPIDRNAVKSSIEEMRKDGIEIFLLFMGAADSWSLETLRNSGGCAIVADWSASASFPQQVFLSIETDLAGGVSLFLSRKDGEGVVNGPVRIVAGGARSIPAQVAQQVRPY
ncbi:MAG TPA: BMP family ABC transporter substrate-binding protein [Spirochaetia bacterium]|nr:BMP family ABC transporter substrate-binding protein [Spirochaetia bacterium]